MVCPTPEEARATHLDVAPSFLALKLPKPSGGGLWATVCAKVLLAGCGHKQSPRHSWKVASGEPSGGVFCRTHKLCLNRASEAGVLWTAPSLPVFRRVLSGDLLMKGP